MHDDRSGYEDTEWWRSHFSGLMLDLWQSLLPGERAAGDADFLQAACRLPAGARLLDVPCGEGRVSAELAARGFRVVGVDISAGLLRSARQRAGQRNLSVEWHEGDMRHLPWERAFDAAFCWGDSFGYMDNAGNEQFLAAVQRALKPGGRWAMEMGMVAEVLFPRYREELTRDVGGIRVALRRSFDPRQGRLAVEYTLTRAGSEEKRTASYRIYSCGELCRMLERAGFVIDRLYGGPEAPFQIGSERLCIVATNGTGN
jgi:ubiquinone/menaquinone biosynthesis C-methylase UbiE